jgi:hypothetical protein
MHNYIKYILFICLFVCSSVAEAAHCKISYKTEYIKSSLPDILKVIKDISFENISEQGGIIERKNDLIYVEIDGEKYVIEERKTVEDNMTVFYWDLQEGEGRLKDFTAVVVYKKVDNKILVEETIDVKYVDPNVSKLLLEVTVRGQVIKTHKKTKRLLKENLNKDEENE